jgi:16S rRNA (guanine966-N2)-methyltransferase
MRITAGIYRGQAITTPPGRTVRPMTDRTRAALFSIYGSVEGRVVLDAYAGSGAVGLEALSRGAAQVEAIEANRAAAQTIHQNMLKLKSGWGFLLSTMTVETWLARQPELTPRYDLIVADPPYERLQPDVLERLGQLLLPDGVLVVSHASRLGPPLLRGFELRQTRRYGDSSLSFYQRA